MFKLIVAVASILSIDTKFNVITSQFTNNGFIAYTTVFISGLKIWPHDDGLLTDLE